MRLRRPNARRGAALIGVTIALSVLLASSGMSFMLAVVIRGKQSAYERDAVQALYAAEAGVAAAVAMAAKGQFAQVGLKGDCGDATWACTATGRSKLDGLEFTGRARQRIGAPVERRVRVSLERAGSGYRVARWEQVPVLAPQTGPVHGPALMQPAQEEERR